MKKSKLRLDRQTVRNLSSPMLRRAVGGTEDVVVESLPSRQSCETCGLICTYSAQCSLSCGCPTQALSCTCGA